MSNQPRFLIIDPQVAFHPGGPLGVKGATEDSERIIGMLTANSGAEVYVSLDSHTIQHIGHYDFWKKSNRLFGIGDSVKDLQGNPIVYEDPGKLFIQPPGKEKVYIEAKKKELRKYAIEYVKKLWDNKDAMSLGKVPMLWPTHCVIGDKTKGRAIYPPLFEALKKTNVKYYKKGENELAEMYSIFKSELQPKDIDNYFNGGELATSGNLTGNVHPNQIIKIQDGKKEEGEPYLNTEFNENPGSLYSELIKGEEPVDIYVCGEALSHCVNYSLRDLVEKLKNDNQQHVKVHLVLNCSSTVVLKDIEKLFFENSVQLIDDILGKYKDYCDIVFWDGTALVPSRDIVEKTKGVFDSMKGTYVEENYKDYLYSKLFDKIQGEVGLTEAEEPVEAAPPASNQQTGLFGSFSNGVRKFMKKKPKGGKRTKKKRHSKTQKKRKGQIKKSKRRSSRK